MLKFEFTYVTNASVFASLKGIDWVAVKNFLLHWTPGQAGTIEIKKVGKKKSDIMLGYYFAVILPMAFDSMKESGELSVTVAARGQTMQLPLDKETVDIFLKYRYGKWKGEYKGKGDMSMGECADYMSWCITWLATYYQCQIPPADPNWRDKL